MHFRSLPDLMRLRDTYNITITLASAGRRRPEPEPEATAVSDHSVVLNGKIERRQEKTMMVL